MVAGADMVAKVKGKEWSVCASSMNRDSRMHLRKLDIEGMREILLLLFSRRQFFGATKERKAEGEGGD